MGPPTQMPLRFEAAILSRTRSPMTSRSNCANDNRTLRVSRPMLVVVLKDWVAVRARKVDIIVVYKVDRLTRSLGDFAKLVELFDQHSVSFVSIKKRGPFHEVPVMARATV